jgi:serine/threonine protein phosphatase PrpC
MRYECVSRTHVGLRRKINEDSVFADSERALWAVADGMGGHEAGEVASTMVTDALRCLPRVENLDELASQAVETLRGVNRQLLDLARSDARERETTIGTTVVGLAIDHDDFRCFWMGDSRAYRLRHAEITRVTHDHSVVQNLVDAGLLNPEEAETHENANLITRAVGVREKFEIEIVKGDVRPGDLFLLASDGLTRVVRDHELVAELSYRTPHEAADRLIDMVMARGAPDNVSLVIVKVGQAD